MKYTNPVFNVRSICIVCDHFVPDNKAIAVRMKYIADALIERGMDVTIMTSKKSSGVAGYQVDIVRGPVASNKDRVNVRLLKEIVFSANVFFKVLFGRKELYLITSPPFTIAFAAVVACRLTGKEYIFDVRDEYPEVYFTEGLVRAGGPLGKLLSWLEKWIYRRSALITTVTTRIQAKLIEKSSGNVPVYLLRNGYANIIQPTVSEARWPFVIMFHGNMGKFQDADLICQVAQLCQRNSLPVEFRIFGWGSQAHIITSKSSGLANLKHFGELPHHEMAQRLTEASLGISFQGATTISRNSFPSKVMEFLGAGIPVLVTPISEAGDFVEQTQVGFQFEPDQALQIFEKIQFLYSNPGAMALLKQRALTVSRSLSRREISVAFVSEFFYDQTKG